MSPWSVDKLNEEKPTKLRGWDNQQAQQQTILAEFDAKFNIAKKAWSRRQNDRVKSEQDSRRSQILLPWSISESQALSFSSNSFVLRTGLINQILFVIKKVPESRFRYLCLCQEGVLLFTPYLFKETSSQISRFDNLRNTTYQKLKNRCLAKTPIYSL